MAAIAYYILQRAIIAKQGRDSLLAACVHVVLLLQTIRSP
jgi:hypothetical protein